MTRPLFITFNYEAWPLATHIELLHEYMQNGLNPRWLDMTGVIRRNFEFPISDRLNISIMKRKLRHTFPQFTDPNLENDGTDELPRDLNVVREAEEVAFQELISLTRNSKPCLRHNKRLFRRIKDLYISNYIFAVHCLLKTKPSQLVLFNGRFVEERAFWNAARDLNCEVVFYETFIHTWHNRYFLFSLPTHSPSYRGEVMENFGSELMLSDPGRFAAAAKEFFDSRASGDSNQFTNLQERETVFESGLPIISFFHSSQDELVMVNLIDQFWTSQEMALLELVKLLEELGGHRLVIRMHPHLLHKAREETVRWNQLGETLAAKFDWITYVSAGDSLNTYDLIRSSRIVVTCASTVGVEASFLGVPSILLGRAFHEDMGITIVAESTNHLKELLLSEFSKDSLDRSRIQAMKYGAFLKLGGEEFKFVSVSSSPRLKYQFGALTISKPFSIRFIQHFEIKMRKTLRRLKFWVLCDGDCGTNSSQRWKQRYPA